MEAQMDVNRIVAGMIRAIRLDKSFYEEVEHDPSYNQDALAVVLLVSSIGAFGGLVGSLMAGRGFVAAVMGLVVSLALAVLGYYFWVFVAHYVGTRFFNGSGDREEVQRAFGFAYSPQILNVLSFIPCLGGLIGLLAWLWSIVAGFIAIRQSLDQDDKNAALTVVISGLVVVVILGIVGAILTAFGLGVGALSSAFSNIGR
jgi:hypothetical protein